MKKTVFQKAVVLLLSLAMLLSVVACTSQGDTPVDTSNLDTSSTDTADTNANEDGTSTQDSTQTQAQGDTPINPSDFVVSEEDGVAHVTTPAGLTYDMTGYQRIKGATATFSQALNVTFAEGTLAESFNRFTMTYDASVSMMVYVTYKKGSITLEHDYFVEAGKGTFSGLVEHFLDGNMGEELLSLRIESCEGKTCQLTIANVTTQKMDVPKNTVYISNDVYKLGVDLSWGGTINFIKDLNNPVGGLNNLVNKFDTGRLIQQSFYGVASVPGEYEPGEFNNSKWVYNPVQGGDKYNNASRLIDLEIAEDHIYIKSQPQDWSLDNQLTRSYMENTYTLKSDHIRVDNRFIDFSGWTHPTTSQELPAVYTVSYLDTFVWYAGDKSWTDDALSYHSDLNFWGDPAYASDCLFMIRGENTETWCAWINGENDYGLGIYVPSIDRFTAGRCGYNGTKNPTDSACSYVAPLKMLPLVSYEALSYSYIMTTGSVEEIRDTFKTYKDFATNEDLNKNAANGRLPSVKGDITKLDFTTEDNVDILSFPVDSTITYSETESAVQLTAGSVGDVSVTIPYATASAAVLDASAYTTLKIEYMIPTTNAKPSYQCDFFFCTGDVMEPAESVRLRKTLIADGEYHVLEIDLTKLSFWDGQINKIRFDYFDFSSAGDVMYLKSFQLLEAQ